MITRGFHRSNKAYYARKHDHPSIDFGLYDYEGGTSGEMCMEWVEVANKPTPLLRCYDDAWRALSSFKDLFDELEKFDSENISDDKFVEILLSCGFKDLTKYNPD